MADHSNISKNNTEKTPSVNRTQGLFFKPVIQPKLSINQPNDAYEHEADAMAENVMRMTDSSLNNNTFFKPAITPVQRKCAHCEEEEKKLQRKEDGDQQTADTHTESYINSLSGKGRSLSNQERSFFEPRFGRDFSNVQLHTNNEAGTSAKNINALAYTTGNNIVFGEGQYNTATESGKHLMAHELTHVVQQNENIAPLIQKVDDASFERTTGVDRGLASHTLTAASFNGQTYSVDCNMRSYNVRFRFTKAYKGTYPYQAATGQTVKGVYVKIEASITDNEECGRCTPMKLIQVDRDIAMNAAGDVVTAQPNGVRDTRAGWGNASASSRGWYVDTIDSAVSPYVSDLNYMSQEGSETSPAIMWDSPGNWSSTTNAGVELYTCAVCQNISGGRWIAACVQWGFFTDSSGNVEFRPAVPVATCSNPQQVRDASERWDAIPGNTRTGITF